MSIYKNIFGNENPRSLFNTTQEVVEKVLERTQETAVSLFRQGQYVFFDPAAQHSQCHLYAERVREIAIRGVEDRDHDFLLICLLTSKVFVSDKRALLDLVERYSGKFRGKARGVIASTAARLVKERLVDRIRRDFGEDLLSRSEGGFHALALANPVAFPFLAGISLMLQRSFVLSLKVKVISQKGSELFTVVGRNGETFQKPEAFNRKGIRDLDPILVLTGVTLTKTSPIKSIMEGYYPTREYCSRRLHSTTRQHALGKQCVLCYGAALSETDAVRDALLKIPVAAFLRAAGADITLHQQSHLHATMFKAIPELKEEFEEGNRDAMRLGLSIKQPTGCVPIHMYVAPARTAFLSKGELEIPTREYCDNLQPLREPLKKS